MRATNRPTYWSRMLADPENSAIWLVAVVGLSLSFAALLLIRQQLEANRLLDFEWVAQNRIRAVSHALGNSSLAVTTIRDHILASGGVDQEGFRRFAESFLDRNRGIESLAWVPRVTAAERSSFPLPISEVSGAFGSAMPERPLKLLPANERDEYFPVLFKTPQQGSGIPTGLDLGSIPVLAETLARARERGRTAASGRIAYPLSGGGIEQGIVVVEPLFEDYAPKTPAAAHKTAPTGFVVGFLRLESLTRAAISLLEPRGVDVLILDESAPPGQRFLYYYASRLAPRHIGPDNHRGWWDEPEQPKIAERVQVADRSLAIVCGRTVRFRSADPFRESPWVVLIAGLLFTVLLSFYLARVKENIRQRSAMEQRLKEREELFRQMTETVDEAFWATAADGRGLLYLSPAYGKVLGIADDDPTPSLIDAASPEDRPRLVEALQRIGREGGNTEVIHRIRRADGVLRWVRTRSFAVHDARGRIYRLVGSMEDITARKLADEALRESEAKLRELFQRSPDVIMLVDGRGKILLMNRSVPALLADKAVGHNALALVPRELRKWFRKALKKVFRKGDSKKFEYSSDDDTYWEGRILPIRSEEGPVTAAMVIAGDVTEKRNLQAQALRNARLASIGVLAAGVAHEINNPNNAIQFNAGLLSRAWQDLTPILIEYYEEHGDFALGGLPFSEARESFPRLLSEIGRNSERIRRIVQNLKHMSRRDAGELAEEVDVEQVLEATLMILHNQIQKSTDSCTLEVPDVLPRVRGNSQQLEQVFINVLLNALQSLPDRSKGVHIAVSADPSSDRLTIAVRDQGRGIAEQDLGRLTEPFFTTRTDVGGTGLGLSMSRSIVERHGGSMSFESEPGRGTTVTIHLPTLHEA